MYHKVFTENHLKIPSYIALPIIKHNLSTLMVLFLYKDFCFLNHFFSLPPLKGVLAFWSEVVHMRFEVEFEDVIFVDVLRLGWNSDWVAEQREAGQRIVILRAEREPSVVRLLPKYMSMSCLQCSPGVTYRRRGWSWWTPPRVFASRCCSWTFSAGFQKAGSRNTKGINKNAL